MEGTQIGGYRVLREIGAGGMGVVWLAEHVMLGRKAAIKILHTNLTKRPEIVARFFNEARATTAISDPGIVQVFDFGHATDGSAYIVMELLEGEPLGARLKRHGALSIGDALRIIRQVASSVGAAHAKGIVHRDLKPDNVFIVKDAEVAGGERTKILDFGIAKLSADNAAITSTSAVMGTPLYMSPEQCRGAGKVDRRSDVYSLGCMLFKLISGRPPFRSRGSGDLIIQHVTMPPPRLSTEAKGVTREIDELVDRCLAKDPAKRYASGTELANAIDDVLTSLSASTARRVSVVNSNEDPDVGPTTLGSSAFATAPSTQTLRRGKGKLYPLVGGSLVGVSVAVVIYVSQSSSPSVERDPVASPQPPKQPEPIDERPDRARSTIRGGVGAFLRWADAHAGEPCPSAPALELATDPWGEPYEVTCVDQPGGQRIGVRSRGPDRKTGTEDDITSWSDRESAELAKGERWTVREPKIAEPVAKPADAAVPPVVTSSAPKPAAKPPTRTTKPPPKPAKPIAQTPKQEPPPVKPPPKPTKPTGIVDLDGDGIPDAR